MKKPRLIKKSAERVEPQPSTVRIQFAFAEQAREWLAARSQGNPRAEFDALSYKIGRVIS